MNVLTIIQGDSVNAELELTGVDAPDVVQLYFEANCFKEPIPLSETEAPLVWILTIPYEETSDLNVGRFKYNIIADLVGGSKATIVYNQPMEVLYKDQKWTEAN